MSKTDIRSMYLCELEEMLDGMGEPKFRAKQIFKWLQSGVSDFSEMTNIPKSLAEKLNESCYIASVGIVRRFASRLDETVKYVYELFDGEYIESVLMKYEHGYTVCISTQVGCRMGCSFCASGINGLTRSLTASEMLAQITAAQRDNRIRISNVVMMGMGEPLDNLDEVLKALELLTATYGYAWSPKRITLSTVGLRKGLQRFIEENDCHLAISLHSPLTVQRAELMPAEKAFSITEMVELLKNYDFSKQRRLSFEYIVFDGINDSTRHADALIKLVQGLECRINLIRFHDIPDTPLHGVSDERMVEFRNYLTSHGLFSTIRASRGQDIFAACGLLSTAKQEAMKREE